jgi:hypothetical protein
MEPFIVVSGLPASGKSTLAGRVADALDLPHIDKDEILEALFDGLGAGDTEWRARLSRAADRVMCRQAGRMRGAVLSSWWRHPKSSAESGTPVGWLRLLPASVVELHCRCRPPIAAERFIARTRHAGHLDDLKTQAELLASFEESAALGPLGLGRVVEINTEDPPDLDAVLLALVQRAEERVRKLRRS